MNTPQKNNEKPPLELIGEDQAMIIADLRPSEKNRDFLRRRLRRFIFGETPLYAKSQVLLIREAVARVREKQSPLNS